MLTNRLITIEGVAGVGKTTAGRYLLKLFQKDEIIVKFLGNFEPIERESLLSEAIRRLIDKDRFLRIGWERETALLIAELLESIEEDVIPALISNKIVIYECYYAAILAYQSARLKEYPRYQSCSNEELLNHTEKLISPFFKEIPIQKYTILLTCSQDILRKRNEQRDQKPYNEEDEILSKRIYKMFLFLMERINNCVIIDTTNFKEKKDLYAYLNSIYNQIKNNLLYE
ncbi:MAG: Thymidylate kinase [Candidatus Anoxychlamydiales bacterium]|uniref:dTMP kinase n=1 Tax=marine sediment metagenome TaxID=412755 RepID=A0A0F9I0N1_9ZZZZ|nr:Thymidylate kinase [Candidatus Anoxychlamydiales bacterium]